MTSTCTPLHDPLLAAGLAACADDRARERYRNMSLARRAQTDVGPIACFAAFTVNASARGAVKLPDRAVEAHHPDDDHGWRFPDGSVTYAETCNLTGEGFISFST